MAATVLSVQKITRAGLEATYTAAHDDGVEAAYHKDLVFHVKQGEGAREVTLNVTRTVDGQPVTDPVVTVGADEEHFIGPFTEDYIQANGRVLLSFDATTNTTVAALRLGLG